MKVHIYASYKRSPVGFQLGSFSFVKNQTDNYVLKYWQESKLIYDLFEQNFIVQASGRLPHSNKFIHLVKNLEYTYTNRDDFGKIVYINIAFEFTDSNDYSRFVSGYYSLDEGLIVKRMSDFILPNTDNKEYGLVIDQERFKDFVKDIFDKPISHMPDINHLELVTKASSRTNFDDKVYDIFKIKFEREGNKYFYPPKKNIE